MKRCRAHADTQFLVSDVTILRSTLMPGLICNDKNWLKLWCAQSLSRSRLTALNKLVGWRYPCYLQQGRNRSRLRPAQCLARQCRFEPAIFVVHPFVRSWLKRRSPESVCRAIGVHESSQERDQVDPSNDCAFALRFYYSPSFLPGGSDSKNSTKSVLS